MKRKKINIPPAITVTYAIFVLDINHLKFCDGQLVNDFAVCWIYCLILYTKIL